MAVVPLANYNVLNKNTIYKDVYDPSEDTFILIDALEKDLDLIRSINPLICLEVGSGSGVVTTSLATVLGGLYYLCTDLNPFAALATKGVSQSNHVSVEVINCNFVDPILSRLRNCVDLLICNPPYGVTPSEEVGGSGIFKATSGGVRGREVMDRLFPLVPQLLSKKGMFYLTCIQQNDIGDITQTMAQYGLEAVKVLERKCGIERLYVLRFNFKN